MGVLSAPLAPLRLVLPRTPRASIIVVNYNGKSYLDDCLGSLLADPFSVQYEIILLDNASSDGSADYVEQHYPAVRLVRSLDNSGYAGGNNEAAASAAGEYLAFLNPDTRVETGWCEALLAALEANPEAGLATSRILMLSSPDRINTCGNDTHCSGLTLCRGAGRPALTFSQLSEVSAVSGACFVIRRALFKELGGFDHSFFMYMEDTDLSWRARLAGYKSLYVPGSVVYHDYRLRFGPRKTFYQERNRYLMMLKVYRWRTLLALLPALILAEIVTWGFVLTRDRAHLDNKLRVYAWIVTHWRSIMQARRASQALRRVPDHALLASCTHALAFEQTGDGLVATVAHYIFDPLFGLFHQLALRIVRW